MSDEPTFQSDDPIGEIDDRIARYLARTIVHVRRFFPFYAGGVAFLIAMLVLPVVGDGGGGRGAALAGSTSVAGAASGSGPAAAAATGNRSGTGIGAAAAGVLGGTSDLVSSTFDDGGAGFGGEVASDAPAGGVGAAIDGRRTGGPSTAVPDAPPVPDTPSADDGGSDEAAGCAIAAPSPAPTVTPTHEISGAQDTAEAAAHQQLPADVGATAAPVTDTAVCSIPPPPVAVPSVPLPATPVGGSTAGNPLLQMALSLLFR